MPKIKNILFQILLLICIFMLVIIILAPYGVFNIPKDTKRSQEKTQESFSEPKEVLKDPKVLKDTREDTREATEDIKETPKKPHTRRPLKFRKFRVIIDIYSKDPQDDRFVRQETERLFKLAKSVSNVKDIKIIKLQGVSVRKDKEKIFDISLD